jgi:hypothetical protein
MSESPITLQEAVERLRTSVPFGLVDLEGDAWAESDPYAPPFIDPENGVVYVDSDDVVSIDTYEADHDPDAEGRFDNITIGTMPGLYAELTDSVREREGR